MFGGEFLCLNFPSSTSLKSTQVMKRAGLSQKYLPRQTKLGMSVQSYLLYLVCAKWDLTSNVHSILTLYNMNLCPKDIERLEERELFNDTLMALAIKCVHIHLHGHFVPMIVFPFL